MNEVLLESNELTMKREVVEALFLVLGWSQWKRSHSVLAFGFKHRWLAFEIRSDMCVCVCVRRLPMLFSE